MILIIQNLRSATREQADFEKNLNVASDLKTALRTQPIRYDTVIPILIAI